MGWHVVRAFTAMQVTTRIFRFDSAEVYFQIGLNGWIGVFLDQQ